MLDIAKIVLNGLQREFNKCCVIDEINKTYRHARIWVRYTYIIGYDGETQMREEAHKVNGIIKNMRWARMKELGYSVPAKYEEKETLALIDRMFYDNDEDS